MNAKNQTPVPETMRHKKRSASAGHSMSNKRVKHAHIDTPVILQMYGFHFWGMQCTVCGRVKELKTRELKNSSGPWRSVPENKEFTTMPIVEIKNLFPTVAVLEWNKKTGCFAPWNE